MVGIGLLVGLLVGIQSVVAQTVRDFEDVPDGHVAESAIEWAAENGITEGVGNNRFGIGQTLTRYQMVTFLCRAFSPDDCLSGNRGSDRFSDVSSGHWANYSVGWAVSQGITSGVSATEFGGTQTLTREQMVTLLYRARGKPTGGSLGSDVYEDVPDDPTHWANPAIGWAFDQGVTGGIAAETFGFGTYLSREEMVLFLCRTLAPGTCPPSQQPLATAGDAPGSATVTVSVPGFTLSGTVSDARRNGQGLAGLRVLLENGEQQSATTDQDGRYRFSDVSGTVTVTASGEPSYITETVVVTVSADRTIDFSLNHTGIPPYHGTVFITPNILGPEDPTSLQDVTYIGRRPRVIYDRRPDAWITVNAFLFRVRYEDTELEFQVNPEFGSREAARMQVDTYAAALGRLPAVFLSRAQKVQINDGYELFGGNWHDRSFLIHAGQGREYIRDGYLEEMFIHEGAHVSLDGAHANSAGWLAAQIEDGVFISSYARDYPDREDIAESILPYFALRYRPDRLTDHDRAAIVAAMPNRLAYFDQQRLDLALPDSGRAQQ